MADSDDPVVASYDVYITQLSTTNSPLSSPSPSLSAKALVLQYPAFRPSSRPYNADRSQKPHELRLKPNTGLLEVDIPILTQENYNEDAGLRYGRALSDSKNQHGKYSYGLAGGFHTGSSHVTSIHDVPANDDSATVQHPLHIQTLGGKIVEYSEREPIYFLGLLHNNTFQLSRLDGVVQMRPQLHHLDAEEEANQKRYQNGSVTSGLRGKAASDPGTSKVESRAIEVKLKDTKDETRDRTLNENAKNLRDIQIDTWRCHNWVDQNEAVSQAIKDRLKGDIIPGPGSVRSPLKSSLSNGDWLDRMSAPREDGKKGLLAKLRGRERERARRKKAEEERRLKAKAAGAAPNPGTGPLMDQSSDSDASSQDATDLEMDQGEADGSGVGLGTEVDVIEIKEEGEPGVSSADNEPASSARTSTAKRRGRPKKVQPATLIELDD